MMYSFKSSCMRAEMSYCASFGYTVNFGIEVYSFCYPLPNAGYPFMPHGTSALFIYKVPLFMCGYHVSPDINECNERSHNCHENATCTNLQPHFNCTCDSGYTGTGVSCSGKCLPYKLITLGYWMPVSKDFHAKYCAEEASTCT